MLFQSIEFLIFLPIVFLLYWFVFKRLKYQNLLVLVASYIFYGWWDWRFLILIAITSGFSYWSGIMIKKFDDSPKKMKWISTGNIVLNLLILCVFKYFNFFAESFVQLFNAFGMHLDWASAAIILPVGISFYTFQALSYTIDVYRKKIEPTTDIVAFFAYISFFPQLVAGPIERSTNLLPQFQKERVFTYENGAGGLRQMLWGFFKKIVIADQCAKYVDAVFTDYASQNGSTILFAVFLFSIQIYTDFSGYSDIAIGTAKLFGIKLMRNFNNPYFSRDIAEFWRRWHISLTTWFRDYVYIPLGGSRVTKAKIIRNTFIIFLLSGFWHGANWTFIAWGAYHALLFLPLILLGKNRKFITNIAENQLVPNLKESLQMLLTFVIVAIGWVFFRSTSINNAFEFFSTMFNASVFDSILELKELNVNILLICILIMALFEWFNRNRDFGLDIATMNIIVRHLVYWVLIFAVIFYISENESFIYFQF